MEGLEELPKLEDRPRVPEPLPTPESLGGIREDEGEVETLEIEESVKESQAASIAHILVIVRLTLRKISMRAP